MQNPAQIQHPSQQNVAEAPAQVQHNGHAQRVEPKEPKYVTLTLPARVVEKLEFFCSTRTELMATLCLLQSEFVLEREENFLRGDADAVNDLAGTAYFAKQILAGLSIADYLPSANR